MLFESIFYTSFCIYIVIDFAEVILAAHESKSAVESDRYRAVPRSRNKFHARIDWQMRQ